MVGTNGRMVTVGIAVLAMFVAGCGGDDDGATKTAVGGSGGGTSGTGGSTGGSSGAAGTGVGESGAGGIAGVGGTPGEGPLPEGDTGIASAYPNDEGIEKAPGVVFAHDFEDVSTPQDLRAKWDVVFHEAQLAIPRPPHRLRVPPRAAESVGGHLLPDGGGESQYLLAWQLRR